MARGSLNFIQFQLQQNTTGFGFQLGLHHNACLVRLHLSCDFSTSVFSCPFYFLLSNEYVLKCSEVQYFKLFESNKIYLSKSKISDFKSYFKK